MGWLLRYAPVAIFSVTAYSTFLPFSYIPFTFSISPVDGGVRSSATFGRRIILVDCGRHLVLDRLRGSSERYSVRKGKVWFLCYFIGDNIRFVAFICRSRRSLVHVIFQFATSPSMFYISVGEWFFEASCITLYSYGGVGEWYCLLNVLCGDYSFRHYLLTFAYFYIIFSLDLVIHMSIFSSTLLRDDRVFLFP